MTPEARALNVMHQGGSILLPYTGDDDTTKVSFARNALVAAVRREITAAVVAEREACATTAEVFSYSVAEAIRARSVTT